MSFLLAPEEVGSYKKIMKTLNGGNVSLLCPKYLFNSQTLRGYWKSPFKVKYSVYTDPCGTWGRCLTPVSFSMKRLGVLLLPLDGMPVHCRVTPSIFAGTHLYTWVKRSSVRVKCLA